MPISTLPVVSISERYRCSLASSACSAARRSVTSRRKTYVNGVPCASRNTVEVISASNGESSLRRIVTTPAKRPVLRRVASAECTRSSRGSVRSRVPSPTISPGSRRKSFPASPFAASTSPSNVVRRIASSECSKIAR